MTHAERMKEIKERVAKASIGPWSVQVNRAYHISYILRSAAGNKIAQFFNWQDIGFDVNSESNSNFIAHARADIPYLISRVEELEETLTNFADAMESCHASDENYRQGYVNIARLAAARDGNNAHHAQGDAS